MVKGGQTICSILSFAWVRFRAEADLSALLLRQSARDSWAWSTTLIILTSRDLSWWFAGPDAIPRLVGPFRSFLLVKKTKQKTETREDQANESCNARRVGRHWRASDSISKKKGKNHGYNNHHKGNAGKSKPKTLTPKAPPLPPAAPRGPKGGSSVFNVLDFGAKGDGTKDDTKAFQAAWAAACKVEASTINVPAEYVFLVGPISFSGPYCQHNIVFQIDGTIVAPTGPSHWASGLFQWLLFTKLVGLTIKGSGTIDGNGAVWWQNSPYDDDPLDDQSKLIFPSKNGTLPNKPPIPVRSSLGGKMPSTKPTALRFYGSFNVTVTGITIQNSPQCHLKFDNCIGVQVYNFSVSSPGDSPNTDGIHLQNSKDVLIRSSKIACGDDCVSIQTGCTNVYIHNINCGPGHGISIGGLGKDNTKACVSNITVRDIVMHNTMNGVRIKTWQGPYKESNSQTSKSPKSNSQ
ncbi:hypothetical protein DH2020_032657 [Rehmannia glutinosa]|uniref:Polygalacturonase-like protein n=1 Tax=Rehmannia glutinosa TaxID=99300 RepID=A0ABR0VFA8_REHGL